MRPNDDADPRETQLVAETLGALDVLELVLWSDELARAAQPCEERPAIFREEE